MLTIRALFVSLLLLGLAACEKPPYNNIGNEELSALLQQGVAIVDIRRPEEWRETGIVEGSGRMTFVDKKGRLVPGFLEKFSEQYDKNQPIILICRTGNRSSVLARHLMTQMGYTQVYNVRSGITGWKVDKLPVVKS